MLVTWAWYFCSPTRFVVSTGSALCVGGWVEEERRRGGEEGGFVMLTA
jgi:hypothetical protein